MFKICLIVIFTLLSSLCFAHTAGNEIGFSSGLSHPILGMDHLLAMVAIGILSYQIGSKAIWKIPVSFVIFMLFGGVWGLFSMPILIVEMGIALSVVILGIVIYINQVMSTGIALSFVSFFAIFHGYAHGMEIPQSANSSIYVMGFLLSTILLHFFGILLAKFSSELCQNTIAPRYVGLVISIAGGYFVLSV